MRRGTTAILLTILPRSFLEWFWTNFVDNVKSVNSMDNVSRVNSVHNVHSVHNVYNFHDVDTANVTLPGKRTTCFFRFWDVLVRGPN